MTKIGATLLATIAFGSGCSHLGSSRPFSPAELETSDGWVAVHGVPFRSQTADADSGIAALGMIFAYWGLEDWPRERIEATCSVLKGRGTPARELRACARGAGLESHLVHGVWDDLVGELRCGRPVVVGLATSCEEGAGLRYEVVVAVHPHERRVVTLDPARGWREIGVHGFLTEWEETRNLLLVFSGRSSPPGVASDPAQDRPPRDADLRPGSRR